MKKIISITIIVIIAIALIVFVFLYKKNNNSATLSIVPGSSDMIVIISPIKDSKITSPLSFAGRARGTWFFEGSFPVILTDWDGKIIAEGHASAQGDWMTEDFVKFIGSIEFDKPYYGEKGTLIFRKDNPSGLPEYDDAYEISVLFK